MLEVWAGPLSDGRIAVVLFNRSPGDDTMVVHWSDIGATGSYAVYDIWKGSASGVFAGSYTTDVPARATVYLLLTPAA